MIRLAGRIPTDASSESTPKFERGQLILHRRYGYRGVIIDFELKCTAGEKWYQSNMTHPDKNQPWYHVLVHGTVSTTYAAEENLRTDTSRQPIEHPLVARFFKEFLDGRYIRNDEPWPS